MFLTGTGILIGHHVHHYLKHLHLIKTSAISMLMRSSLLLLQKLQHWVFFPEPQTFLPMHSSASPIDAECWGRNTCGLGKKA